jgi:CheY-like chemotaxis protein
MSKSGAVVIIEDDEDDKEIFELIMRELGIRNKIEWFPETQSAFTFLATNGKSIFLIFCDINMPGKNGLEFKRDIDADPELRRRSIPFIFYSTAANQEDINEAYVNMTVQGFFQKSSDYGQVKKILQIIFDYWANCKHPNA